MISDPKPGGGKRSVDYSPVIFQPPDSDITPEDAREEIARNFPEIEVSSIESIGEGMNNRGFEVNGKYVFRFPRKKDAARSCEIEIALLPELRKAVSLPIPNPEYVGRSANDRPFMGYESIPGTPLAPELIRDSRGAMKPHLVQGISQFFREIHSFDIDKARRLGAPGPNLQEKYTEELERVRETIYPVLDEQYPQEAEQLKAFIEKCFADYLNDPKSFEYQPAFLHGDLIEEHILYSSEQDKLTGIIDFGNAMIGDPVMDLARPYSYYGKEFIDELLKTYPCSDRELLFRKVKFYMAAQIMNQLVRNKLRSPIHRLFQPRLDRFKHWVMEGEERGVLNTSARGFTLDQKTAK